MQALWMVAAAFVFAVMSVCVKFASQDFNAAEIVFYRGLVSMVALWWLRAIRASMPGAASWG
jgi:drug/metabolite transporter (DMT)-like permease